MKNPNEASAKEPAMPSTGATERSTALKLALLRDRLIVSAWAVFNTHLIPYLPAFPRFLRKPYLPRVGA